MSPAVRVPMSQELPPTTIVEGGGRLAVADGPAVVRQEAIRGR
jgi:hypothetical protein